MKYLCLLAAEKVMEQMTDEEARAHYAEYREYIASIQASGHYAGCNRLLPPSTATTVRVRQGRVTTTDGPFAETKEQLGGYFVNDARDLNEAIQIAARIPCARIGSVEIRPIADDPQTLQALGLAAG